MGFRFRKSIKILPGIRLNLTQKGISSVSVGDKGLTINQGKKGTRVTASIPGSGLSYSQQVGQSNIPPGSASAPRNHLAQPPVPHSMLISPRLITGILIIGFILWLIF